jgi:hypothetical protein
VDFLHSPDDFVNEVPCLGTGANRAVFCEKCTVARNASSGSRCLGPVWAIAWGIVWALLGRFLRRARYADWRRQIRYGNWRSMRSLRGLAHNEFDIEVDGRVVIRP